MPKDYSLIGSVAQNALDRGGRQSQVVSTGRRSTCDPRTNAKIRCDCPSRYGDLAGRDAGVGRFCHRLVVNVVVCSVLAGLRRIVWVGI